MSRVTAPVAKLTRALNVAPPTGATLMPKYAELLRRSADHTDSSRGLTTTHRPTPQPSIAHRTKPFMQTFYSDAGAVSSIPAFHLDVTMLPAMTADASSAAHGVRVPILPDNYNAAPAAPQTVEAPVIVASMPQIVAVDPSRVAAMSDVEGVTLAFAHQAETEQADGYMLKLA
jgi:hypothetical protein